MNNTLGDLRHATLATRKRLSDQSIGTRVEAGRVQVVRVEYLKGGRTNTTPLSDWFAQIADAVAFLNSL